MRFSGKTALVTGAASGIGLATAALLEAEGARVVRVDKAAIDAPNAFAGDIADEMLWQKVAPAIDGLDLAVACAGVAGAAPLAELDLGEWRRILSANLDGAFLTLRAAMRAMRDGGAIVVVASIAGVKAEPGIAAYAASKAGAIQLARVAAKEGFGRRIRVNAIAPGGVETPIWRGVLMFADIAARDGEGAAFDALAAGTPLGRFASPGEIAEQIAHLLSDASASVTGAVLAVDGGYAL